MPAIGQACADVTDPVPPIVMPIWTGSVEVSFSPALVGPETSTSNAGLLILSLAAAQGLPEED